MYCWAHIRRDVIRAGDAHPELAGWTAAWTERIGALYVARRAYAAAEPGSAEAARAQVQITDALATMDTVRHAEAPDPGTPAPARKVLATLDHEWDGLLTLPPPRTGNGNRRWPLHLAAGAEPFPVHGALAELRPLRIRLISSAAESKTWNTLVATHHYLGYSPLPGAQLRYLIESDTDGILALAGFGASAWKCAARDTYLGWDPATREANLQLVVGNARFLIARPCPPLGLSRACPPHPPAGR